MYTDAHECPFSTDTYRAYDLSLVLCALICAVWCGAVLR